MFNNTLIECMIYELLIQSILPFFFMNKSENIR